MSKSDFTLGKPIVRKVGQSDKKDESTMADGTSDQVRSATEIDKRVTKAVLRATRAVEAGVEGYSSRRDSSASKTKDGALVDAFQNLAHGVSKAISEGSPIITDVAEAVSSERVTKPLRKVVRNLGVVPFLG